MAVTTYEGVVEKGKIRLKKGIKLPENANQIAGSQSNIRIRQRCTGRRGLSGERGSILLGRVGCRRGDSIDRRLRRGVNRKARAA